MTNHDVLLVFGLWAVALLVWGLVLLHDEWQNNSAPVEAEDPTDTEPAPVVETYRVISPADVRDVLADPDVPPIFKAIVAQAAHNAGMCGCGQPYDQDSELTDTDIDWLESQRGEAS